MKNLFKITVVLIATFGLINLSSCSDDEVIPPFEDNSIAALATQNSNLSILVQALNRAGLVPTLADRNGGPYTVFAPTNQAFEDLLADLDLESINQVPVDVLTPILLNHVVAGTNTSSSLTTGYVETLANGAASPTKKLNMFINKAEGVLINGMSSVSQADIIASNGIIHVVDKVITLPTVVTFAAADPTFSSLVNALTVGTPNTDFVSILSGDGPFTVFAPTNTAFEGAPSGLTEEQLEIVLKYHVVSSANVLSSTLTNGQVVSTFASQNFTVNLPGTLGAIANITDTTTSPAGIIEVDVQANNGVVHVLNKVLIPSFM